MLKPFLPIVLFLVCITSQAQNWTKLTTIGTISARNNASAIYDSRANRMVLFGGTTNTGNSNELWSFDLLTDSWSLLPNKASSTPAARFTHVCTYDSLMDRMLLFSGQGSALYNDVWAYNFSDSTWEELFADGNITGAPLKRYGNATAFDPINRKLINFAGFTTSGRFDDTWSFDVDTKAWTDQTTATHPLLRCLTSTCYATDRKEMIVYAGQSTGNLNDIWSMNANTFVWSDLTPTQKPTGRHYAGLAYTSNDKVVMFGGNTLNQGNNAGSVNDMWKFNLVTNQWDTIPQGSNKPEKRSGHTMIYVPQQDKLILFGGIGIGSTRYADTWVFNNISTGIINDDAKNEITVSVFPNPFTTALKIKLLSDEEINLIELYSILGEKIQERKNDSHTTEIIIDQLDKNDPGIYLLKLTTRNGIVMQRVIKQ